MTEEKVSIAKRLVNLLNKDIKAENESKKVIVIIRSLYIFVSIYYIFCAVVGGGEYITQYWYVSVLYLAETALVMFLTYRLRTKPVVWIYNLHIIVWVYLGCNCWGIKSGIQDLILIPVLLFFFSSYGETIKKIVFTILMILYRSFLFIRYEDLIPKSPFTDNDIDIIQIAGVVVIFLCVAEIAYVFSRGVGELEGKLVKYNDSLKKQANTDQLTGLFNRRRAIEYLDTLIEETHEGTFSLAIGDIDFFKKVNDVYGHDAGDMVLKEVSRILESDVRRGTFIARWGGEEFLIVFPGSNGDEAWNALERIRKAIEDNVVHVGNQEIKVTMTFGLTEYDFAQNVDSSIKEADEKLYQGKENGRNRVVY